MVPITLNGVLLFGVVTADGIGVRVRVTADEFEQLGVLPGRQLRIEAPGTAGTFLLTTAADRPPFVFLRLQPLASRFES
jgi:hypothetical protein